MFIKLVKVHILSIKNIIAVYFRKHPLRFIALIFAYLSGGFLVYLALFTGLNFLISLGGFGSLIIQRLFSVLFFIVFCMTALSFCILFYTSCFRAKETKALFILPIDTKDLIFFKFNMAAFSASWIPVLGLFVFIAAYSKINNSSFFLPVISILYLIPFVVICCFLGYCIFSFILKYFALKKIFIFSIIALLFGLIIYFIFYKEKTSDFAYLLSDKILLLKFSKLWFLPSSWASEGIISLEHGHYLKSFILFLNLWSLSCLCLISFKLRSAKNFIQLFLKFSIPKHKVIYLKGIWDKIFSNNFLPRYFNAFFLKDIKLFLREPILWMQFLIFFGLLFFYFINLRRLSYHLLDPQWKNLLAGLNMFSILCVMSALAVRFVFPQWSLEGRSYWIIKLSPISLGSIYREKFIFSWIPFSLIAFVLIYISNKTLQIDAVTFYLSMFVVCFSTVFLVGFSASLGAYYADFTTENYLKSVETIGGLANLLLNFFYVVLTVFGLVYINHLYIISGLSIYRSYLFIFIIGWVFLSCFLLYVFTAMGLKKLKNKEY